MVLVDTSVWIRFLAGREPYVAELKILLSNDAVLSHDLVYAELFIGDVGGRAKLLAQYERMQRSAVVPHQSVVDFVRARRLNGKGPGWIDIHLLASALVERSLLWTADPRLASLARELGIDYAPLPR